MRLEFPKLQNWSCHKCTHCCRDHIIEISDAEKKSIEALRWPEGVRISEAVKPHGKKHRLAHQSDGACVFLGSDNLCRIHAIFGEASKPLACRVFPFAVHPAGQKLAVSLRFSCPAVAGNLGAPVGTHSAALTNLARSFVPPDWAKMPAPALISDETHWPDLLRIIHQIDLTLSKTGEPIWRRMATIHSQLETLAAGHLGHLTGGELDEVWNAFAETAESRIAKTAAEVRAPGRYGKLLFRLMLLQYIRKDTVRELENSGAYRRRLFFAALRFVWGRGRIPEDLRMTVNGVTFQQVEETTLPPDLDERLTRYLRVKVQGLHFCGAAYHRMSVRQGFQHLALAFAAILWVTRWLSQGRPPEDAGKSCEEAIGMVEDHFGYSPSFATKNFQKRVETLSANGEIEKLMAWYSR